MITAISSVVIMIIFVGMPILAWKLADKITGD